MNPKMLSSHELLARVKQLAEGERAATAALIAHLAELDERRLYLGEGCSSLFTYCTQILHLSEHAAYRRIEAARVVRRFPIVLERLEDGSVNLTTMSLLAAHLTPPENHQELLDAARHRSKRQVEELVAWLRPQPPIPISIRRLPTARHDAAPLELETVTRPGPSSPSADPDASSPTTGPPRIRPALVSPLAPRCYRVQFTASPAMVEKLRLAQDLLRHQIPDGDPGAIFDRALTALLESLAKQKLGATDRPGRGRSTAPGSRYIPAAVKRTVWLRDGGRCAFVSSKGRRCTERGFLEFHHVTLHGAGGPTTADNIQLRCRTHNGYEAELYFGLRYTERVREERAGYLASARRPHRWPKGGNFNGNLVRTEYEQTSQDRIGRRAWNQETGCIRVMVIGGTRFIGLETVGRLSALGHEVVVFHRGQTTTDLPRNVQEILGDRYYLADSAGQLKDLAPDVVLDMIPLGEEDTRAVCRVFTGVARRIVAISSQDVFRAYGRLHGTETGPPEQMPLTEDAPLRERFFPYRDAATGTDDSRYNYEKILVEREIMGNSDLPGTVLRLPAVYGPRDPQHRLFPYLKRMDDKRPGIILDEVLARWRWSRIYVENAASAITLAVTDDRAGGRVYNIAEPEVLTEAEWVRQIGRGCRMGRRCGHSSGRRSPAPPTAQMGRTATLHSGQYPHPARFGIQRARGAL